MGEVIVLTEGTFEAEVLKAEVPVLVDFFTPWCAPCRVMGRILDGFAKRTGDRFRIGKLDVDAAPSLAARFNVEAVPTLLLFIAGRPVTELYGLMPEGALALELEKVLTRAAPAAVLDRESRDKGRDSVKERP
jgi:thioredoxin 1